MPCHFTASNPSYNWGQAGWGLPLSLPLTLTQPPGLEPATSSDHGSHVSPHTHGPQEPVLEHSWQDPHRPTADCGWQGTDCLCLVTGTPPEPPSSFLRPTNSPCGSAEGQGPQDNLAFCLLQKGPREEQLSSPRLKAVQILPVRVGSRTLNMRKPGVGTTVPELRCKQRLWKAAQMDRCQKLLPHRYPSDATLKHRSRQVGALSGSTASKFLAGSGSGNWSIC